MTNLDQIQQKVNNLKQLTSNIFEFSEVFEDIQEAGRVTPDADRQTLSNILSSFRGKLPNLPTFKLLKATAQDLAENLALATIAQRRAAIDARNQAITSLNSILQKQIDKGNADAILLRQIKNAIEQGTAVISELRDLVDKLTATDAGTVSTLRALINTVGNISSIF
jgi:hypothetical protein